MIQFDAEARRDWPRPLIALYEAWDKPEKPKTSHLFQEQENTLIFQVTSCLRFVTTNVDFAYIESE